MLKAICPCQNSIVAPQGLKVSKVRTTRSERKVLEDNVSVDAMRLKMSQIDLSWLSLDSRWKQMKKITTEQKTR